MLQPVLLGITGTSTLGGQPIHLTVMLSKQLFEFTLICHTLRQFGIRKLLIECFNHLLKDKGNLVHSRHRSVNNFLMNLIAALGTYCLFDNKPEAIQGYSRIGGTGFDSFPCSTWQMPVWLFFLVLLGIFFRFCYCLQKYNLFLYPPNLLIQKWT